jgi:hypothetical protein
MLSLALNYKVPEPSPVDPANDLSVKPLVEFFETLQVIWSKLRSLLKQNRFHLGMSDSSHC